ncbi:MAG: hypothetical protein AAFX56_14795 [Pseudomonadota bacterium]
MTAIRRCAYLTMSSLTDFVSDADASVPAMAALGWEVEYVPWRTPDADWNRFDMVYLCTPWDYQDDPDAYLAVLENIDASKALLVNPLDTVRWNLDKRYLRDLERQGTAIVPSVWHTGWSADIVDRAFDEFAVERIVLKPQVGANADFTYVLDRHVCRDRFEELAAVFADRPLFAQPFIASIQTEGEYSLFYFGGAYSHAIVKQPAAGDFRSQEEHGAEISGVEADPELERIASAMLSRLPLPSVYARADFVRGAGDEFLLMELELNEPSLYFRVDSSSPARFAAALDAAFSAQR